MRLGEVDEALRGEGFDVVSVRRRVRGGPLEVELGPGESAERWKAAQARAAELVAMPAAPTLHEAVGVLILRLTSQVELDDAGRKARAVVAKHVRAARERRLAGED